MFSASSLQTPVSRADIGDVEYKVEGDGDVTSCVRTIHRELALAVVKVARRISWGDCRHQECGRCPKHLSTYPSQLGPYTRHRHFKI